MRTLLRLPLAFVFTVALVGAAGCAYLRDAIGLGPQKPQVHLTDIVVTKASLAALDLAVTLRIDNPNDFSLTFSKLRYEMEAAGLKIASGTFNEAIAVPSEGHALVKLPLSIDAQNAIRLAQQLLNSPDEIYALLKATAEFETPVGGMNVSFEDKRALKKLIGR